MCGYAVFALDASLWWLLKTFWKWSQMLSGMKTLVLWRMTLIWQGRWCGISSLQCKLVCNYATPSLCCVSKNFIFGFYYFAGMTSSAFATCNVTVSSISFLHVIFGFYYFASMTSSAFATCYVTVSSISFLPVIFLFSLAFVPFHFTSHTIDSVECCAKSLVSIDGILLQLRIPIWLSIC